MDIQRSIREVNVMRKKLLSILMILSLLLTFGCSKKETEVTVEAFDPNSSDSYYEAFVSAVINRTTVLYEANELTDYSKATLDNLFGGKNSSSFGYFTDERFNRPFVKEYTKIDDSSFGDKFFVFCNRTSEYNPERDGLTHFNTYMIIAIHIDDMELAEQFLDDTYDSWDSSYDGDLDASFKVKKYKDEDYIWYASLESCACGLYHYKRNLIYIEGDTLVIFNTISGTPQNSTDILQEYQYFALPVPKV